MNMMDKIKDMEKRYHDQGANAESEEEDGLKSQYDSEDEIPID
jgi:hypothetical protein